VAERVCWGDMHLNLHGRQMEMIEETFAAAKENLDFFPIAYYPYDFELVGKELKSETIGVSEQALRDWERVREMVRAHHDPGRFVTFAGYEWHGNRRSGGDHNVFYLGDGPLALPDTLPELYAHCRATGAIAIPHHTAYRAGPGSRGKDWDMHDETLSPVAEIYSAHGCSEGVDAPLSMVNNLSMGPRVSGGTIQDGLAKGHRLGIIASNDMHSGYAGVWGCGLVGAWVEELTREAIWEALRKRRVYGVTGDRMVADFRIEDAPMGSAIEHSGKVEAAVSVVGEGAVDRIELLRNNRVIATHCHQGTWEAGEGRGEIRAKLRVLVGWGPGAEYGFEVAERQWRGMLRIEGGEVAGAQGCFTRFGQRHWREGDAAWCWELTTSPRSAGRDNRQGIVFELTGAADSRITVETGDVKEQFTLAEALREARVLPQLGDAQRALWEQFGLKPEDIESPDVLYHNAHKLRIQKAVPEAGYTAQAAFTEEAPPGRNWYYVRVSQTNGQMAWSSPIWVEG